MLNLCLNYLLLLTDQSHHTIPKDRLFFRLCNVLWILTDHPDSNALNIKTELRNLSFLDGTCILNEQMKIKELDILFKKII